MNAYQIIAPRNERALYYAWEYGTRRAVEILRGEPLCFAPVRTCGGTYRRRDGLYATRRDAQAALRRVREIVVAQIALTKGVVGGSLAEIEAIGGAA